LYKTAYLLKRKTGMSLQDFIDYYETKHSKFVSVGAPRAKRYLRKYLRPTTKLDATLPAPEPEFDVIMEIWWESKAAREEDRRTRDPKVTSAIIEDEANLFDSTKMLVFEYEEHETQL
jgi:hypothetical protein